ncbi:Reverse transcriptase domain-containing protein [Balamuthia mandrillaris]
MYYKWIPTRYLLKSSIDILPIELFSPLATYESGFCFVLVIINIATRTAAATTSAFYRVICDFGFPKIIQSDNSSEFVNETMANIKAISGFDHRFIAAYHLQANGAEARVKHAKSALIKLADFRHKLTPFELFLGRPVNLLSNYSNVESDPIPEAGCLAQIAKLYSVVWFTAFNATNCYKPDCVLKEELRVRDGSNMRSLEISVGDFANMCL